MTQRITYLSKLWQNGNGSGNGIPRFDAVVSRTIAGITYQICGFWSKTNYLIIAWRTLQNGAWTYYHYDGIENSPALTQNALAWDEHNSVAVKIDANGYIHCSFGMHDSPLQYRRSDAPLATWTGGLTANLSIIGVNETLCTYPQFSVSPTGKMYFFIRNQGASGDGNWGLFEYTEATTSWAAAAGTGANGLLLDGMSTATDYSAYPYGTLNFSDDWDGAGTGFMHIAWTWRRTGALNNANIYHVRWNGTTWTQWDGTAQTVPIIFTNGRIVATVAENRDHLNSCFSCLDANNRMHVLAVHKDTSNNSQLHDYYFNGTAWIKQVLTAYTGSTYMEFVWNLIVCDKSTNQMRVFFCNILRETPGIIELTSDPSDFSVWTKSVFYNEPNMLTFQPSLDIQQWEQNGILTMILGLGDFTTPMASAPNEYPFILEDGALTAYGYSFGGII